MGGAAAAPAGTRLQGKPVFQRGVWGACGEAVKKMRPAAGALCISRYSAGALQGASSRVSAAMSAVAATRAVFSTER